VDGEPAVNQVTGWHWVADTTAVDIDQFFHDGYVAVRGAVDAETVAACRERIWQAMARHGVTRDDPATWPSRGRSWPDSTQPPTTQQPITHVFCRGR
jgi:hypothetical protein